MIKEVIKTWGKEVWLNNDAKYCMKVLHLNKDKRCSYHYHEIKKETFYVSSGLVELQLPGSKQVLKTGDYVTIEPMTCHFFRGLQESVILEASSEHFDTDSYRVLTVDDKSMKIYDKLGKTLDK